jgi:hypothetical protein
MVRVTGSGMGAVLVKVMAGGENNDRAHVCEAHH